MRIAISSLFLAPPLLKLAPINYSALGQHYPELHWGHTTESTTHDHTTLAGSVVMCSVVQVKEVSMT